jgi:malonyl-CoA O-methyltransferase
MLNPEHVRRRFNRVADQFDGADFVHATTRQGLLARLAPLLTEAKIVVDLGCATGTANQLLRKRFRGARIISVDFARRMLERAREKKSWLSNAAFVQARAEALPFANESVDVIFSNQLLPWVNSPATVFSEVARVLRKGGVFAFATLGPDSFREIRHAWRQLDDYPHVNSFPDMHDLGDSLVSAGLRDPVLDVDRLCVDYGNADRLLADLAASGARNALASRRNALTGKHRYAAMLESLGNAASGGRITLDLELVYGHCWGAGPKMDPANYRIDASRIPLRRN